MDKLIMQMRPQDKSLLAFDLDGTLFGVDHHLSSRTIDAVHAVIERGHSVVIVTGRSAYTAVARLESITSDIRLVCSNGAYEFDRTDGVKKWSCPIPAPLVKNIQAKLLQDIPRACFGWESEQGLGYDENFIVEAGGAQTLEQGGLGEMLRQSELLKLFVRTPDLAPRDLLAIVEQQVAAQAEVSTSGAPFVELTAAGVNKASGLARVADELGFLAEHTIAFGDNLNDLPMLDWAREGVAMGNALDEVKKLASTLILSNAEDGVATLLEERMQRGML